MHNVIYLHETQSKTRGWAEVQDITMQRADLFSHKGFFLGYPARINSEGQKSRQHAFKSFRCGANSS